MPDRILPDDLLNEEAWLALSDAAARFFIALWLTADDFGLMDLTPLVIGRRAFEKRPPDARLDRLISELTTHGKLRVYFAGPSDAPKRYGFLPRYRQRLRQMKAKHPLPPESIYADDGDATEKFIEHKHLFSKMPAGRTQPACESPPEAEVKGREKEKEEKGGPLSSLAGVAPPADAPPNLLKDSLKATDEGLERPRVQYFEKLERSVVRQAGESDESVNRRKAELLMREAGQRQ